MRNYIRYKLWDLISYPFPNIKGAAIEVSSHILLGMWLLIHTGIKQN